MSRQQHPLRLTGMDNPQRWARWIAASTLSVALTPWTNVHAQRFFAEGGVVADHDPTLRSSPPTTSAVSGAAGLFLSPNVSVRLEVDLPRWRVTDQSRTSRLATRMEMSSGQERNRARSWTLFLARHFQAGSRLNVAAGGGATCSLRQWGNEGVVETRTLEGTLIKRTEYRNSPTTFQWWAVTGGADVSISLTRHLAVIPEVRINSYLFSDHTSLLFVRSRIAARWMF